MSLYNTKEVPIQYKFFRSIEIFFLLLEKSEVLDIVQVLMSLPLILLIRGISFFNIFVIFARLNAQA